MSESKKVMYLIGTLGHGRGGHFYSLRTTAEALSDVIDPYIVNIGKNHSPVIDLATVSHETILFSGWNLFGTLLSLIKIVKKVKPDVIHTFDMRILWFGRVVSIMYNIPHIHTITGGPNPIKQSPFVKECILYSQENFIYFEKDRRYENTNFYLLPNRVVEVKSDKKRLVKLKKKINSDRKTILRIARFDYAYKKSIIEAIDLTKFLNHNNYKSQLVIIGAIEVTSIFQDIKNYISVNSIENVYIFTDDEFTVNASELIDIADLVIGTGRSIMEAASRQKVLLTPVIGSRFPILVTEENFMYLFNTNFSPRNSLNQNLINENINNILAIMDSTVLLEEAKKYSKKIFLEYFFIGTKKQTYKNLYKNLRYTNEIPKLDFVLNFLRMMKNFIKG